MDLGIGGLGPATEIGAGASARVYRARQIDLDREVAVKVLSVTDDSFLRRFNREAKTLGKLSQNPGIVTVYDTGVTDAGNPYLILELCTTSVHERLKQDGRFEPMEACAALAQVADAVADAHANGVIHRDLKPGNVLRSAKGSYLVTDFGISTVSGATMGQTESVGFTAGYVAPETLVGDEPAGTPADVYALGATLFHMVAGRAAFVDPDKNANLLALAQRVINDPVADLRTEGVPDEVCVVIEKAMAKDPAERPTAAELGELLLDIVGRDGASAPVTLNRGILSTVGPIAGEVGTAADGTLPAANASSISEVMPRPAPATSPDSDTFEDGLDGATLSSVTNGGPPLLGPTAAGAAKPLPINLDTEPRLPVAMLVGGAVVGLLVLLGVTAGLIFGLGGGEGDDDGVGTVAGTGIDDASQDQSLDDRVGGNSDTLDPFRDTEDPLSNPIAIPDVIGRSADAAEAALREAGFAVTRANEPSATVAEGRVSRQNPAGGEDMAPGGQVTIYISTGRASRTVTVPTVAGMSVAEATEALTAVGLGAEETPRFDDTVPSGDIIGSTPPAGTKADAGSIVNLLVSQGPAANCASVIGLSQAMATTRLEAAGLTVTSTSESSSTVADGMVISCTATDQAAQLTVSSGPSLCNQVIGVNRVSARSTLEAAGYTVNAVAVERDDLPVGEVFNCTLPDDVTASIRYAVRPPTACPTSVVGSTIPEARAALAAIGITDVTVSAASSATVPKDRVISCSTSGTTASVISSTGPAQPPVTVPDLVGMTRLAAQAELNRLGLPSPQVVEAASPRPVGEVVATNPVGGTSVSADTVIVLTVSSGPGAETAVVPGVGGSTQAVAEKALTDRGFVPSIANQVVPAGDPTIGTVLAVSPGVGTTQPVGATVTITVGVAPAAARNG